jgi:rRNA maturation protein Nop10
VLSYLRKFCQRVDPRRYVWSDLGKFGTNSLLKTSYLWIVIVPIAAKVTSLVDDPLVLEGLGEGLVLNMSLPFRVHILYLASVCASCGHVLYFIYCPQFSKFDNLAAYRRTELGTTFMGQYALDHQLTDIINSDVSHYAHMVQSEGVIHPGTQSTNNSFQIAFLGIRNFDDLRHPRARVFCAGFYSLAIIGIVGLCIESFWFMFSFAWPF